MAERPQWGRVRPGSHAPHFGHYMTLSEFSKADISFGPNDLPEIETDWLFFLR